MLPHAVRLRWPNEKSVYIGVLTGKLPSTATNLLHGRGELAL